MLTFLICLPLLGAAALLRRDENDYEAIRLEALLVSLLTAVLAGLMWWGYTPHKGGVVAGGYSWVENWRLSADLGIHYHVGVDGISTLLVMLTGVLGVVAVLCSQTAVTERVKAYHVCLLVLEGAMLGVFCSLDLLCFYVFFELTLIPMYFLIGIWGGANRQYATLKFVLFTLFGSLLMLVAILWLATTVGGDKPTFDLVELSARRILPGAQMWLFAAFALAFAIKVPVFPLHTWLPDAHTEAPTAGSILLAGVLLKMGSYGLLRIAIPLFPHAAVVFAPLFILLALIGILYGALVSLVQTDIKRLVAYSSVAHMGFVVLGLFSFNLYGLGGGMLQQISHGVSTGALFLMIGMIYERRHSRQLSDFGGLWTQTPVWSRLFLLSVLASVGVPGLCGFAGEFSILLGTAQHSLPLALLAGLGVILAACYLLWMVQASCYGEVTDERVLHMSDMDRREIWCLAPLVVLMFWIGLQPNRFVAPAKPALAAIVERVKLSQEPTREAADGVLATPRLGAKP